MLNTMTVEDITIWTIFKNLSYVLAYIATVEWLGFNPLSLNIFVALMIIDVITGVVRACQVEGCHTLKSSIGIRGVLSKILLLTALFSIALTAKGMGYTVDNLVQGAVSVLTLGELYSILGNIHSARTGKPKQEFDAVTYLLSKVKDSLKQVLK
jgi:toxin secretion/phage lysis holin